MLKRNTEGLQRSAQLRHQQAEQRADEGIRRLLQEGRSVNFNTVSEVAHVSPAWLYQHPEVRKRIEYLREQPQTRKASSPQTRASTASKDAICTALRQRVKHLEEENAKLKEQMEVLYGQLCRKQS